eukprot:15254228-Ditylum_brightwellii.AAC.1
MSRTNGTKDVEDSKVPMEFPEWWDLELSDDEAMNDNGKAFEEELMEADKMPEKQEKEKTKDMVSLAHIMLRKGKKSQLRTKKGDKHEEEKKSIAEKIKERGKIAVDTE